MIITNCRSVIQYLRDLHLLLYFFYRIIISHILKVVFFTGKN